MEFGEREGSNFLNFIKSINQLREIRDQREIRERERDEIRLWNLTGYVTYCGERVRTSRLVEPEREFGGN